MDAPSSPGTPRSLPARELDRRLQAGEDLQIVDVREDQELEEALLPLAVVHLPLSRYLEWMPDLENRLDRLRPVVVLCHAGIRSWHFGCCLIQQLGFTEVWNLQGGIDAWSVEVDPRIPRY